MNDESSNQPLPGYEVEFIPAERRLNARRSSQAANGYAGPERRREPRRDRRASDAQSGGA